MVNGIWMLHEFLFTQVLRHMSFYLHRPLSSWMHIPFGSIPVISSGRVLMGGVHPHGVDTRAGHICTGIYIYYIARSDYYTMI